MAATCHRNPCERKATSDHRATRGDLLPIEQSNNETGINTGIFRKIMKAIIGSALIGGSIAAALPGAGIGHADDGWMFDHHGEIEICADASVWGDRYAARKAASHYGVSESDAETRVAIAKSDCAAHGLANRQTTRQQLRGVGVLS
jgi:hypothetical protein